MSAAEWRPVEGWPYEASPAGEIRRARGRGVQGTKGGRVLKPWAGGPKGSKAAYVTLSDRKGGDDDGPRRANVSVLSIIEKAYMSESRPEPEPNGWGYSWNPWVLDFRDGDPFNLSVANLEWVRKYDRDSRRSRARWAATYGD